MFRLPHAPDEPVAIALSGGPDSMALAHMLAGHVTSLHALTVDHGLRPESAEEAATISRWLKDWPNTTHTILKWNGEKPQHRQMEEARFARYDLMAAYCKAHGLQYLYLAHHLDDQAETFLFRLAKGSGLDGLGGMHPEQSYHNGLTLMRPLLSVSKDDLLHYCAEHDLSYVTDPTNLKQDYARPRLRQSRAVLEQEGLSNKRLAKTAERLRRAADTLNQLTQVLYDASCLQQTTDVISLDLQSFETAPEELRLRVLRKCFDLLCPNRTYAPRLEKIEELSEQVFMSETFKRTTLAGLIIEKTYINGVSQLHLRRETC